MAVSRQTRIRATAIAAAAAVGGMAMLALVSGPIYDAFCRLTGYAGTTQRASAAPGAVGERIVTVRFNADVARGMPWRFAPVEASVGVRPGEERIAIYRAHNPGSDTIVGTATFNVTPEKAARYFDKIACFCFQEQRLAPGESADLPVSFFVDPAILDDPGTRDIDTITLSYTFFVNRVEPKVAAGTISTSSLSISNLSTRE